MTKRGIDDYLKSGDNRRKLTYEVSDKLVLERLDIIINEIKEIKDRIEAIETVLEDINSRILLLEEKIDKSRNNYLKRSSKTSMRNNIRELLQRVLQKEAYLMASELKAKIGIQPSRILDEAYNLSNVSVIHVGGEAIIINNDKLSEFKQKLASIRTSDPYEAGERLGIYKNLFNLLQRAGIIYYDIKARIWRILE